MIRIFLGISLLLGVIDLRGSEGEIEKARARIEQWVQTRQIIAEEKSNWEFERQLLEETQRMLKVELKLLEEKLMELKESSREFQGEREQLKEEKAKYIAASAAVKDVIGGLEKQTMALVRYFPLPLKETIDPLIRRIPKDPQTTTISLGARIQNIIGILSQADKFNSTVTFSSETRTLATGKEGLVRTLYWGLTLAYSVDTSGDFAAIGFPTAEGWKFEDQPGAGEKIQLLMDVYEGTREIQFVSLPAKIR